MLLTFKTPSAVFQHESTSDILYQIENENFWNDVIYIDCSNAQWETFPFTLPKELQLLICGNNKLTALPTILPVKLRGITAYNNKIKQFPDLKELAALEYVDLKLNSLQRVEGVHLPSELKTMDLSYNTIEHISAEKWPEHLSSLNLEGNRLVRIHESLDQIVPYCEISLKFNDFPWQKHNAWCMWLTNENVDEVATTVERYINYGMTIPVKMALIPITQPAPPSLFNVINPPPAAPTRNNVFNQPLQQTLDNILNLDRRPVIKSVYDDAHNVHASSVQNTTNTSLDWLIKLKEPDKDALSKLTKAWRPHWWNLIKWLDTFYANSLLDKWCKDTTIHSVHGISYFQLIGYMYNVIDTHKDKKEILKILQEEIIESENICFTGRFTKTLNVLNGFVENVVVGISNKEQMQNRIVQSLSNLRKQHSELSEDYVRAGREQVKLILDEFEIPQEEHDAWLDAV